MKPLVSVLFAFFAATLLATALPIWSPIGDDSPPILAPTIGPGLPPHGGNETDRSQGGAMPGGGNQAPGRISNPLAPPPNASVPEPVMKFGISHGSLEHQTLLGIQPDYGSDWVGAWTLTDGWHSVDLALERMRAANVTPAIHFYYWGDDIKPECFQEGCWSELHDAHKDNNGWYALAGQLVDHLNARMGGDPVMILLESEFNKESVQSFEELDGRLADMVDFLHERYPAAKVVLALGNWNSSAWGTWDRAAAASDAIGLQGVRGSTHDSVSDYVGLYNETLKGAQLLQEHFEKPIILTDIALSNYPEDEFTEAQTRAIQDLLKGLDALEDAGVDAILYRSWQDTPTMDPANRYGPAERHWGLVDIYGRLKPAAHAWIAGILAERGDSEFHAVFDVSKNVNEYWVEVSVVGNRPVDEVWIILPDNDARQLTRNAWGAWSTSVFVPGGSEVRFIAIDGLGDIMEGGTVVWNA